MGRHDESTVVVDSDSRDGARVSSGSRQQVEQRRAAELSLLQSASMYRNVIWCCFGLTTTILLYGYDFVIVGTVAAMPSFQRDFGQELGPGVWILPSLWLGLWTFASPGGSILGALCGGQAQDLAGRRATIVLGSLLSAVAVAVCYVSYLPSDIDARRGVLMAGKAFQGFAIGMVTTTTQTYMSEILPLALRGPILAFFPMFTLIGQLIGAGVIFGCMNMTNGYTSCFASQWPFSFVPIVIAYFVPESPTYLVRKNRLDAALRAQRRLEPADGDAQQAVDTIRANIAHERTLTPASYIDCFRGVNLRRTLIVMFSGALPQLFGLSLLSNGSYFIQVVGMSSDASILVLIIGLVISLVANTSSLWILHHVGRRRLSMYGLFGIALIWLTMGISGIWNGEPTIKYTAFCMVAIVVYAGLTVWPASYAFGAETSSLHLRAKTQGIGWLTAGAATAIFGFVLPYLYNPDRANLKSKTGFIYAGLCVISGVITYLCVPEMKGYTAAEIDAMFESRLPAKGFKNWSALASNDSHVGGGGDFDDDDDDKRVRV